MADVVVVNAPLAELDGREWLEFSDFTLLTALQNGDLNTDYHYGDENMTNLAVDNAKCCDELHRTRMIHFNDSTHNNSSVDMKSVNCTDVDAAITSCFRTVERIENCDISCQQDVVNDSQIWRQLSSNCDNAPAVDWSQSCALVHQENSLNLRTRKASRTSEVLDLSDDEDLQQAMDFHALITAGDHEEEPLASADQVISEIEEMMEEDLSPTDCLTSPHVVKPPRDVVRRKLKQAGIAPGTSPAEGLATLSLADLSSVADELEATVRCYSESLVTRLAEREELDYIKELNNQFISLLLSIQRRRRQLATHTKAAPQQQQKPTTPQSEPTTPHGASAAQKPAPAAAPQKQSAASALLEKMKAVKSAATSNSSAAAAAKKKEKEKEKEKETNTETEGLYLTTVIPYDHHQGPPDAGRLQVYIKIMTAIDADSPTVPNLLTDYILRVLCPTT